MSELEPIGPERQALADAAHQMDREIREIKRQMESLWVLLAERLYHFRVGEMWKDIGYPTLQSWLDDPGVEVERRWMYKITDAYRFLVIEWGVPLERVKRLKISKVNEVLPAIRRGQVELEAGLSDAETLRRDDLEVQYRGLHSSMPGSAVAATSPVIETEEEPEWATCPTCGSSYRRRARDERAAMGGDDRARRDMADAVALARLGQRAGRLSAPQRRGLHEEPRPPEGDKGQAVDGTRRRAGRVVKRPTPRIWSPRRRLQGLAGRRKRYHGPERKAKGTRTVRARRRMT
jgi:hypothetical protein